MIKLNKVQREDVVKTTDDDNNTRKDQGLADGNNSSQIEFTIIKNQKVLDGQEPDPTMPLSNQVIKQ